MPLGFPKFSLSDSRKVVRGFLFGVIGLSLTSCFSSRVDPTVGKGVPVNSTAFRAEFVKASKSPWVSGNEVKTLPNGAIFFPQMLAEVKKAKASITLETFAFVRAQVSRDFVMALSERSRAGVAVKVILDDVGSAEAGLENIRLLREAGVDLRFYHPVNILRPRYSNNRTHRKILVVDGNVAFTGGAGFAYAWTGNTNKKGQWRDTQYEIRGPAVASFQAAFRENWLELTGVNIEGVSYFPRLNRAGGKTVQVVYDDPWNPTHPIAHGVIAAINGARTSLVLQQSYFVPNRDFRKLLLSAAARGVKVEVMVPNDGIDSKPTRHASQNHWAELLKGGIRIYQYEKTMMHAKLLVADERLSIVGSANFDDRSFFINDEINLHVDSRSFAREQLAMFRRDVRDSREITLVNLKAVLAPGYKRFFASLLSSQL